LKIKSNTRVAYPTILVLCYNDIKVVQEVDIYETICQIALEKLIKYGLPANEKYHQEQPKFQLTIPKGHNITNIAKYN